MVTAVAKCVGNSAARVFPYPVWTGPTWSFKNQVKGGKGIKSNKFDCPYVPLSLDDFLSLRTLYKWQVYSSLIRLSLLQMAAWEGRIEVYESDRLRIRQAQMNGQEQAEQINHFSVVIFSRSLLFQQQLMVGDKKLLDVWVMQILPNCFPFSEIELISHSSSVF